MPQISTGWTVSPPQRGAWGQGEVQKKAVSPLGSKSCGNSGHLGVRLPAGFNAAGEKPGTVWTPAGPGSKSGLRGVVGGWGYYSGSAASEGPKDEALGVTWWPGPTTRQIQGWYWEHKPSNTGQPLVKEKGKGCRWPTHGVAPQTAASPASLKDMPADCRGCF